MGFNKFISKIFGNKAQRDLNKINPIVNRIKEAYPSIEKLSNDELRAKTKELEAEIQKHITYHPLPLPGPTHQNSSLAKKAVR